MSPLRPSLPAVLAAGLLAATLGLGLCPAARGENSPTPIRVGQPDDPVSLWLQQRSFLSDLKAPDNAALRKALCAFRRDRANAYYHAGRYLAAQDEYRQSLRLDPTDALTRYQLGFLYHRRGFVHLAALEWRKAVDLDPTLTDAADHLDIAEDQVRQSLQKRLALPDRALPDVGTTVLWAGVTGALTSLNRDFLNAKVADLLRESGRLQPMVLRRMDMYTEAAALDRARATGAETVLWTEAAEADGVLRLRWTLRNAAENRVLAQGRELRRGKERHLEAAEGLVGRVIAAMPVKGRIVYMEPGRGGRLVVNLGAWHGLLRGQSLRLYARRTGGDSPATSSWRPQKNRPAVVVETDDRLAALRLKRAADADLLQVGDIVVWP